MSNYSTVKEEDIPLISIVSIVYNNVQYIRDAIESVLAQDYPRIEYVLIDGGSSDGTVDIIEEYCEQISIFISEPDEGIYDALNKGIRFASGDMIGILHSDDVFCDEYVVSDVIQKMSDTGAEICFSDMIIVDDKSGKIIRYYMSHYFKRWMFRIGWMPPHPTAFTKKSLFEEFGLYSLAYKVVGDFDFFVRIFYAREIHWAYLDRITVKMRRGGISNSGLLSKKLIAHEINRSLRANHVWSTPALQIGRYFIRLMELIRRPEKDSCRGCNSHTDHFR